MNAVAGNNPTTSDISQLMYELGYVWSNEAQVYYSMDLRLRYDLISQRGAEGLYKYLLGNSPYSPLKDNK